MMMMMTPPNPPDQAICSLADLHHSFAIRHSFSEERLKGEDVVFHESNTNYELFAVCDGHAGSQCASFVRREFWNILNGKLPAIPPIVAFDDTDTDTFKICKAIRNALLSSFIEIDAAWYNQQSLSGTTMTVVLICGRLLTVANVGDSDSYIHTGTSFFQLNKSHRVELAVVERNRLKAAGVKLAKLSRDLQGPASDEDSVHGLGPVRVWPGGLAVSRSIGDADVSPHVLCIPQIRQVLTPSTGSRFVIASDGVWDHLVLSKVKRVIKKSAIEKCSSSLVRKALMAHGTQPKDDVTVYTVDLVPSASDDFKDIVKLQEKSRRGGGGGPLQKIKKQVPVLRGKFSGWRGLDSGDFLADVDGISMVQPDEIIRRVELLEDRNEALLTTDDFTVHGSHSDHSNFLYKISH
eukprot:g6327.t1